MAQRTIRFNINELARVAATSINAEKCVGIKNCPDGQYNKVYVFQMNDGREVVGKVPCPNVGLPHFAIASEVATMDFVSIYISFPFPYSRPSPTLGIKGQHRTERIANSL